MTVKEVFKSLNGKKCKVYSDLILIESALECPCYIEYVEFFGLILWSVLGDNYKYKWNKYNTDLSTFRENHNLSYDTIDKLKECLSAELEQQHVQLGWIKESAVKNITNCDFDEKGNLLRLTIQSNQNAITIYIQ